MTLKERIKQLRSSHNPALRLLYYCLKPLWVFRRVLTDVGFRSAVVTSFKFGNKYYQRSTFTRADRYPVVFAACAAYLAPRAGLSLLSFGCSTGEEVAALGRYMPDAAIMGTDVNEWCISQCQLKYPASRFSFCHRFSPAFTAAGNFDAVFCMAVFQRAENRLNEDNSRTTGLTFQQFEAEIMMLDGKLKPGGLFVTDNADFSFADTACALNYTPLDFPNNLMARSRPLYGRDNVKMADTQANYRVFVKAS